MVFIKSYCKGFKVTESVVAHAYRSWERSRAGRKNSWRVYEEHGGPEKLIGEIVREIGERNLTFRPIRRYLHHESTNGKTREIGVQSVKQQVVDYVAVESLSQLINARTGFWQVGGVPGKGQVLASKAVRRWSRTSRWHVHMDVRQCYPSISKDTVMKILEKRVKSDDVLYICRSLLDTYKTGLDIGSYFSLKMAHLVLSEAYHHIESLHKSRRGLICRLVNHQIWYMDDCYLFANDKRDLKVAARSLEKFMKSELGLDVKPWCVSPVSDLHPVDIAGFTVRPSRTTLRPALFLRARRAFARFKKRPGVKRAFRACSYWGWLLHANSTKAMAKIHAREVMDSARALVGVYFGRLYDERVTA